ncbi:versican core protein-like isoform X2 [Apostichopus japonicus]|uniref:versican core protein-like isoform X2 n=1 Tax=Stichopus japonicus TaxID=307972 RepID=UPI003AB6B7B7
MLSNSGSTAVLKGLKTLAFIACCVSGNDVIVNECASVSCSNGGTCEMIEGNSTCLCAEGFYGGECEIEETQGDVNRIPPWMVAAVMLGSIGTIITICLLEENKPLLDRR